MKRFALIAALALVAAPMASADVTRYGSLGVATDDIDLNSDAGVHKLAIRMRDRMWAMCGDPHRALQTYVQTSSGKKERAACKANLRVAATESPAVHKAFALALSKFD